MGFELKEGVNRKKLLLTMIISTALAFGLCILFGDIMFSVFSAFCAVLAVLDASNRKAVWITCAAVMTVAAAVLFSFGYATLTVPFGCAAGWLMSRLFVAGVSKGELAFYLTVISLVMLVSSIYLFLAIDAKSFDINAVIEYGKQQYVALRDSFVAQLTENVDKTMPELGTVLNEQNIVLAYDKAFSFIFAAVAIAAFALSGFSLKIFSALLYRIADNKQRVVYWRFYTSNVVAYFYCALLLLSFFASDSSVYAITVNNLFYIFMAVYAYIGYNFALSLLSRRLSFVAAGIIIILAIATLGIFAVEVLSVFGVVFTNISNRFVSNTNNKNS